MIFYFSGTGNSQLAAKLIAESIGDEIVSINHCLKEGKKKYIPIGTSTGICGSNLCLAHAKGS